LRVHFFVQLFSTIKALSQFNRPRGHRLALFANGHGLAKLAYDVLQQQHVLTSAKLTSQTRELLADTLSPEATRQNPVIEPAPLQREVFATALRHLIADNGVDGVLTLLAPDS